MDRKSTTGLERCELIEAPIFPATYKNKNQAAGIAYEKRVARYLKELLAQDTIIHGQWLRYFDELTDEYGSIAQPDILVVPSDTSKPLHLIECKLCYRPEANKKLARLYKPLVEFCWPSYKIKTIQVFRSVPKGTTLELDSRLKDIYDTDFTHQNIMELL